MAKSMGLRTRKVLDFQQTVVATCKHKCKANFNFFFQVRYFNLRQNYV